MRFARIAGTGHHLPERVVTNQEMEAWMETSDAWIRERSGIRERRFAPADQGSTAMGAEAARGALREAGWEPGMVELILFATLSPDMFFPGNGVLLQRALGMGTIGALDVRNQCTGFIYALSAADAYIRAGMFERILVVGAEVHSSGLVFTTAGRDTAVLFGDGGGAVCLEATHAEDGSRLVAHRLHADGRYAEELCVRCPSSARRPFLTPEMIAAGETAPHMNGKEVFRHAVHRFPEVILEVLAEQGLEPSDLALVIPHQANLRITEAVRKRLGLPAEKVLSNIETYGNTTAASIPIGLSEAVKAGRIERGDWVCLAAFGSGFTWGASLLRY